MSGESGEGEGMGTEEEPSTGPVEMPMQSNEEMPETQAPEESSEAPPTVPQPEGRRTQLRRVRDSIQILSNEVGRFRKSHEVSAKKLEAQVASLRKELAAHARSNDMGAHIKSHDVSNRRLEKQISSLRNELVSLRSQMAKEAVKSRAREEAALSRIMAKVKTSRPAKNLKAKHAKKR
jgi:ribosomal protein L29